MERHKNLIVGIVSVIALVAILASIPLWRPAHDSSGGLMGMYVRKVDFLKDAKGDPGLLLGKFLPNGKIETEVAECPFDGEKIINEIKLVKDRINGPVRSELYGEISISPTMINFVSLAEDYGFDYEIVDVNRKLQPLSSAGGGSYSSNLTELFTRKTVPDRLDNWSGTVYRIRSVNIATCTVRYEKFHWPIHNAVVIRPSEYEKYGYFILRDNLSQRG